MNVVTWEVLIVGISLLAAAGGLGAWLTASRAVRRERRARRRLVDMTYDMAAALGLEDFGALRDDPEAFSRRLIASRAERTALRTGRPEPRAGPGVTGLLLLDAACSALRKASETIEAVTPDGPIGSLARNFQLAAGLRETLRVLEDVGAQREHEGEEMWATIVRAFHAGDLNHLLATAGLLSGYLGDDRDYDPIVESYALASAAVTYVLADQDVHVLIPRIPGIVRRSDVRPQRSPVRDLPGHPRIREVVKREARRLDSKSGDLLVVDCVIPGWRSGTDHRPAEVIAWDRTVWLD